MLEGATPNEIAFVAALLALVLVAPKVPRMGEAVGRWLGRDEPPPGGPTDEPASRPKRRSSLRPPPPAAGA